MKRILTFLLVITLIFSLAGCGEKLLERAIEEAGGGNVDLDGDTVTIKGEDGEEMVFGETEWPSSGLAKSIPEFKAGKIVTTMEMNDSLLISLEGVPEKDFEDYLDGIKKIFSEEAYDMNSEGGVTYGAENGEGIAVALIYTADEALSITVTQQEKQE